MLRVASRESHSLQTQSFLLILHFTYDFTLTDARKYCDYIYFSSFFSHHFLHLTTSFWNSGTTSVHSFIASAPSLWPEEIGPGSARQMTAGNPAESEWWDRAEPGLEAPVHVCQHPLLCVCIWVWPWVPVWVWTRGASLHPFQDTIGRFRIPMTYTHCYTNYFMSIMWMSPSLVQ